MKAVFFDEDGAPVTIAFLPPPTEAYNGTFIIVSKGIEAPFSLSEAEELYNFIAPYIGRADSCCQCGAPVNVTRDDSGKESNATRP